MNRLLPFVLSLPLFLFHPGVSWGQSDVQEDQVLDLHREKFQWMTDRDTARLANLLSYDAVYVHSNGWQETRKEMLANIGTGRLRYHRVEVLDARARTYGNTGIVNGRARFDVALEEQAWLLLLDYTEVYIRMDDGALRLVSRHACRVPE